MSRFYCSGFWSVGWKIFPLVWLAGLGRYLPSIIAMMLKYNNNNNHHFIWISPAILVIFSIPTKYNTMITPKARPHGVI